MFVYEKDDEENDLFDNPADKNAVLFSSSDGSFLDNKQSIVDVADLHAEPEPTSFECK